MALPPYHFNCRTSTVAVFEDDPDPNTDLSKFDVPGGNLDRARQFADILESKVNNGIQLTRKEVSKVVGFSKNCQWTERKIVRSGKHSLLHHFDEHHDDDNIKVSKAREYSQLAINLVRNPKREMYLITEPYNKDPVRIFYYDRNKELFLIINPYREEIETFHYRIENGFAEKMKTKVKTMQLNSKGVTKWMKITNKP